MTWKLKKTRVALDYARKLDLVNLKKNKWFWLKNVKSESLLEI